MLNPPAGWIATANQYNLPPGYPHTEVSGREWAPPYRYRRIAEVLGSGRPITVEDAMRLQYDEASLPARDLVPLRSISATSDAPFRPSRASPPPAKLPLPGFHVPSAPTSSA
jgi:penicillin amidase